MGRIEALTVEDFKSIHSEVRIAFPSNIPVVIVGENNVGKSNLVRALDLLLGETWPGSWTPEDHDYFQRSPNNAPIRVSVDVQDVVHVDRYRGPRNVTRLFLEYPDHNESGRTFRMLLEDGTDSPYPSNDVRHQCVCMLIGADRRLRYQLGYSTKWTLLSRLMRKFHEALTSSHERVDRLKTEFERIVDVFREVLSLPSSHVTFATR